MKGRRLVIALAFALRGTPAYGEAPFDLSWAAPDDCPGAEAVRERVDALVSGSAEQLLDRPLSVMGRIVETDQGVVLTLITDHGGIKGERRLSGSSCAEVTSAGSLVIALVIDPNAGEPKEHGAPPIAAFEPSEPTGDRGGHVPERSEGVTRIPPAEPASSSPMPAPTEDRPIRTSLGAFGVLDTAALPGAAFGFGVFGAIGGNAWLGSLEVGYLPPRLGEPDGYANKGGDVALLFGSLVGCWLPLDGGAAAGLCAMAEGGALVAEGVGLLSKRRDTEPWLAGGGAATAGLRLGEYIVVRGRAGVIVPLGRPTFAFVADDGALVEAHRPSALGLRLALSAEWGFR
jgi:hypothetical protein